jgi:hypothetical protein
MFSLMLGAPDSRAGGRRDHRGAEPLHAQAADLAQSGQLHRHVDASFQSVRLVEVTVNTTKLGSVVCQLQHGLGSPLTEINSFIRNAQSHYRVVASSSRAPIWYRRQHPHLRCRFSASVPAWPWPARPPDTARGPDPVNHPGTAAMESFG